MAPRLVPANQISSLLEAQIDQRRRRQARGISRRAHDDHGLPEVSHLGKTVVRGRVQAPLEHIALHNNGTRQCAFLSPLLGRSNVHDEAALGDKAFELVRSHTPDACSGPLDQIVDGHAHGASPHR